MTDAVTPVAGDNSVVVVGGTPVVAIAAAPNGGYITNPYLAVDQDIVTAEPIYIDPVGLPGLEANGTTFAVEPGQTWPIIPGQTTPTYVNANTSGHKFSVVKW